MRKSFVAALAASVLGLSIVAHAAENAAEPPEVDWSFDGIFGTYDRAAVQRGLQVYKEVCSACHSLTQVHYRNLTDLGYSEDQVKQFAAGFEVQNEEPNDDGEMFNRPAEPRDRFVSPFPNEAAARAANGGALPPDLSLMVQARDDGANYVHGILTGYPEPPAGFDLMEGRYYNKYFPGHQIGMPPPLSAGGVSYADGTEATVDQMSQDVVAFLAWTAEPHMEQRKGMGIKVMLFLFVFTGLLLAVKKKVWADVH